MFVPYYKTLLSYKLSEIAFNLGWEFTPLYYFKIEDSRQRDQIKQALRSFKQNIVEGTTDKSLSSKLKLYDVARASDAEAIEDFEDILKMEGLLRWDQKDNRLVKIRSVVESSSVSSLSLGSSLSSVRGAFGLRRLRGERVLRREEIEIIVNYILDVLVRAGYLLDRQIKAVEEKHRTVGGYSENLLKRRLQYRNYHAPS